MVCKYFGVKYLEKVDIISQMNIYLSKQDINVLASRKQQIQRERQMGFLDGNEGEVKIDSYLAGLDNN